jgi:hypothetical protein
MNFRQRVQYKVVCNFHFLKLLYRYLLFNLLKVVGVHLLTEGLCILVHRRLIPEASSMSAIWGSSKYTLNFLITASQFSFVK